MSNLNQSVTDNQQLAAEDYLAAPPRNYAIRAILFPVDAATGATNVAKQQK